MTSAGDSEPVDLGSLRATDALFDRLATRLPEPPEDQDSAVLLLRSLLDDVDDAAPATGDPAVDPRKPRRTGVRTAVALGVASAVLATTGVAAAGGGWAERDEPRRAAPQSSSSAKPDRKKPKAEAEAHITPANPAPPRPARPPGRPAHPKASPTPKPAPEETSHSQVARTPEEIRKLIEQRLHDGTWR
ncbi:hypothetical protein [Actinocorallia longicatena]|uniref:Uncharacterized protein n=1 Tax=Actinocorallia longicatena TaxID=111803 RepID=A0ABP6QFS7_9ACTN